MRSRMASTPLLEAASSSWTSSDVPRAISTHESQRPHGSPSSRWAQLSARARIRAVEVLPVPRGPLKQVGVGHVAVAHRAAQGPHDVGLAPKLGETPGPEPPVEGDERLGV